MTTMKKKNMTMMTTLMRNLLQGALTLVAVSAVAGEPITVTVSGTPVSGSDLTAGSVSINKIDASGTASASTFLRGDGQWVGVGGGPTPRTCPSGSVAINNKTCVDQELRSLEDSLQQFDAAIDTCTDLNGRLCSTTEWMSACRRRVELGINGMLAQPEMAGDLIAHSNSDWARPATLGIRGATVSCSVGDSYSPADRLRAYRCCFDR
jgi:hypothetical protein